MTRRRLFSGRLRLLTHASQSSRRGTGQGRQFDQRRIRRGLLSQLDQSQSSARVTSRPRSGFRST